MFTYQQLQVFVNVLLVIDEENQINYAQTYLFMEDKNDVFNIHQRHWDRSTESVDPYQKRITVVVQPNRGLANAFPFNLWNTVKEATGFRYFFSMMTSNDWRTRTFRSQRNFSRMCSKIQILFICLQNENYILL